MNEIIQVIVLTSIMLITFWGGYWIGVHEERDGYDFRLMSKVHKR